MRHLGGPLTKRPLTASFCTESCGMGNTGQMALTDDFGEECNPFIATYAAPRGPPLLDPVAQRAALSQARASPRSLIASVRETLTYVHFL
jgi:hypothetical protein